jgi:hypothetical protein
VTHTKNARSDLEEKRSMKKKVIALVIDTELTNEQIEEGHVHILCFPRGSEGKVWRLSGDAEEDGTSQLARNVRVLDAD